VTVFERASEVASKCASMQIGDHTFDLGGHLFGDHHRALKQLASDLGCRLEPATPSLEYDLDAATVAEVRPVTFTRAQADHYVRMRSATFPQIQAAALAGAAGSLSQPASDWLAAQDLEAIAATGVAYTASGYGFLADAELAALYPVKFAEMLGVLSSEGGQRWSIAGGMQLLWRRAAGELRDVRLNTSVTRVERDTTGVHVTANAERFDFDDLFLALPLEQALDFLDASENERSLFSRIRYVSYRTTVCEVSGLPRGGFYLIRQHTRDISSLGHAVAFHHQYADSDVYTFYAYGGCDGNQGERRLLEEDIERMGGRLRKVHADITWDYFPHFSAEDLRGNVFGQLEALQGQSHTWYVGSLFSFELVECTVRYAQQLARQRFGRPTLIDEPSASQSPDRVASAAQNTSSSAICEWMVAEIAARLGVPTSEIDPDLPVEAYGLTSLAAVSMLAELSEWLGWQVTPSVLVEYPTVSAIADQLASELAGAAAPPVPVAAAARVVERSSVLDRIRRALR
jgi:acyl carrier protein